MNNAERTALHAALTTIVVYLNRLDAKSEALIKAFAHTHPQFHAAYQNFLNPNPQEQISTTLECLHKTLGRTVQ